MKKSFVLLLSTLWLTPTMADHKKIDAPHGFAPAAPCKGVTKQQMLAALRVFENPLTRFAMCADSCGSATPWECAQNIYSERTPLCRNLDVMDTDRELIAGPMFMYELNNQYLYAGPLKDAVNAPENAKYTAVWGGTDALDLNFIWVTRSPDAPRRFESLGSVIGCPGARMKGMLPYAALNFQTSAQPARR